MIGFKAGGVNASSTHGNLLGLSADDHTQYLLVDGSRAMSGNLNMGGNNIVSVGTVNSVTVEAHATRHQFGGADPVGTVTPSANAIPFADVNGTLDSWVSTATTSTLGKVKLSTSPVSASDPIVVGENDVRFTSSFTGVSYTSSTFTFTTVGGGSTSVTFRPSGSTTTTNASLTTVQTITGITDNSTSMIEVNVKAYQASATNWGIWKRTLTVTKVSGTVTIQEENADVDKQSSGLSANSVSFSVSSGDILVQVTGIAATTINWNSSYDIVL